MNTLHVVIAPVKKTPSWMRKKNKETSKKDHCTSGKLSSIEDQEIKEKTIKSE